jgi:hypothetical protein
MLHRAVAAASTQHFNIIAAMQATTRSVMLARISHRQRHEMQRAIS